MKGKLGGVNIVFGDDVECTEILEEEMKTGRKKI